MELEESLCPARRARGPGPLTTPPPSPRRAGDVAKMGRMGPVPLGRHAPQMDFFRAEYTLNHHIGTLRHQMQAAAPPTAHDPPPVPRSRLAASCLHA